MKATKQSVKQQLSLFWTFFKIGLFTFGGGYAMIGMIEKEIVEKKKWLTEKEMLDMVAIAEATPGVIALNSATYVGAKLGGFVGAFLSSIAVLLPSVIIISLLSAVISEFGANQYVKWAFLGIRACVCALILNAVCKLSKPIKKNIFNISVFAVSLILALLSSFDIIPVDVVFIILGSAIFGIIYGYFKRKKQIHKPEQTTTEIDKLDIVLKKEDKK